MLCQYINSQQRDDREVYQFTVISEKEKQKKLPNNWHIVILRSYVLQRMKQKSRIAITCWPFSRQHSAKTNMKISPEFVYQFVEQKRTWCRYSACFTSFSDSRDIALYINFSKRVKETSFSRRDSSNHLLSSRWLGTTNKMVCITVESFKCTFTLQ